MPSAARVAPALRTVVIKVVNEPHGQIGFTAVKADGLDWKSTRWTPSGQPIALAAGDYLVTAVADQNFREVYRRVPGLATHSERLTYPHARWKVEADQIVLPAVLLDRPDLSDSQPQQVDSSNPASRPMDLWRLSTSTFPSFKLYVDRLPVTLGDYLAAIKELPLRWRHIPNVQLDLPLTNASFEEAMFFAETTGTRIPELDEMLAIERSVTPPFPRLPPNPALPAFWTCTESDSLDAIRFPLMRLWARRQDFPVSALISRHAQPDQVGLRCVRSVVPRAILPANLVIPQANTIALVRPEASLAIFRGKGSPDRPKTLHAE